MNRFIAGEEKNIKKGPILFIMILGAFLTTLNQTVMSVAIPKLIREFNITAATAQWLTTGYMLVNGVLIPITAYLMQRFSTRQLFQAAMWIFLIGTGVSAISASFPFLLSGRMIQAAGAGIIMPLLMNVILALFPPNKRGTAMGMVGLAIIFAPAIGPVISGYILENYSWQTLFYGLIPLTLLTIVLGFFYLQNVSKRVETRLDILGGVLSTIGFGALLYGFSRAGSQGWSSSEVLMMLLVGGAVLVLFVWRQLTSDHPLLNLQPFKYHMFSLTIVINIAVTMLNYADMMLLPLYLQNARGYSALDSGLLMLPGALLMGILMPATGKIFDRFGAKWLAVIGMTITIFTTIGFVNLTDSTSFAYLLVMSTGRRVGMAMLMMPVQTTGLNQLPRRLNAHGTAISNTIRQLSGAMGTSLLVTIMTNRATSHFTDLMKAGTNMTKEQMIMESSIGGINDSYLVIVGFAVLAWILSFFIKRTAAPEPEASQS